MEQKELIAYAAKMDEKFTVVQDKEEVIKTRETLLANAHPMMIALVEALKDDTDCRILKCYNKRFYNYDYNWFDIFIPKYNLGIKLCKTVQEKDMAYQLYRYRPVVMFMLNDELTVDRMVDRIIQKIKKVGEQKYEKSKLNEQKV